MKGEGKQNDLGCGVEIVSGKQEKEAKKEKQGLGQKSIFKSSFFWKGQKRERIVWKEGTTGLEKNGSAQIT